MRATDAGEFSDDCYNLGQAIVFSCCPMTIACVKVVGTFGCDASIAVEV
jgi:hypothetical protein